MLSLPRRIWWSVAGLAGGISMMPPAAAPAGAAPLQEQTLASLSRPSAVAAYAGHTAWSRWDGASRRYRLVLQLPDGTTVVPEVKGRTVPFDVDLGPDGRGRVTAVYSRCRREPPTEAEFTDLPAWWEGSNCRIRRLTVGTNREQPVRTIASGSSYLPSIWRGEIAFAWRRDRRTGTTAGLRVLGLRTHRVRPVAGGARPAAAEGDLPNPGPTSVELRGGRAAFGWSYYREFCPRPVDPENDSNALVSEVRHAARGARRSTRIASACLTQEPSVSVAAGFRGADVVFALTDWRSGPAFETVLHRAAPGAGTIERLADLGGANSKYVDLSVDGDRLVLARRDIGSSDADAVTAAALP